MIIRANQQSSRTLGWLSTRCGLAVILLLIVSSFITPVDAQMAASQHPDSPPSLMPGMDSSDMRSRTFSYIRLDQFEGRTGSSSSQLRWDGEGWFGNDMNKLWLKSEGFSKNSTVSDGDHEAFYDRPIPRLRYFDAQAGVRADIDSDPRRAWAAFGVEGLAPYFSEVALTLYVRNGGHVAGRVTASTDLLLTQKWALQPQAEFNLYSKDDAARQIGSGFSDVDTGVRLRYEVSHKFSPYVGFAYNGKFSNTARYARQAGGTTSDGQIVFGLRVWH
jgi:copper resistance protein B